MTEVLPSAARGAWLPESSHSLQGYKVTELACTAPSICNERDNIAMLAGLFELLLRGRHSSPVMQTSQRSRFSAPTYLAVMLALAQHILLACSACRYVPRC